MNKNLSSINIYVILIIFFVIHAISCSQSLNNNNSFVAIFKVTLPEQIDTSVMGILNDIVEKEIRAMIAKDSLMTLAVNKDSIWKFDSTFSGRRSNGVIFSGPNLSGIMKNHYSKNLIYFYSPVDIKLSHLINGLLIYLSEDSGWLFTFKSEDY